MPRTNEIRPVSPPPNLETLDRDELVAQVHAVLNADGDVDPNDYSPEVRAHIYDLLARRGAGEQFPPALQQRLDRLAGATTSEVVDQVHAVLREQRDPNLVNPADHSPEVQAHIHDLLSRYGAGERFPVVLEHHLARLAEGTMQHTLSEQVSALGLNRAGDPRPATPPPPPAPVTVDDITNIETSASPTADEILFGSPDSPYVDEEDFDGTALAFLATQPQAAPAPDSHRA